MTIKIRNRLNYSLFIISSLLMIINLVLLLISIFTKSLNLTVYDKFTTNSFFLTRYNPYVVITSILFENLYVVVLSYLLYHIFEKTQASDVVFFTLFLLACLFDTFRLWIPILIPQGSYSIFRYAIGNGILFSKILIPFSIFYIVLNGENDQRQEIEKNIFILILSSAFFALLIPLNSAVLKPNFSVDYSFKTALTALTSIVLFVSLFAEFMINRKLMHTQKTTIGLCLLCLGITHMDKSVNIIYFFISATLLTSGTVIFLKELHRQYLFDN